MRKASLVGGLLLVTFGFTASAEVLDLGVFKPVTPRPESGIEEYHYWKDGRTILVEAMGAGKEVARLELSWPGDMTAHVHCTTPAGREVTMIMNRLDSKFEFVDHKSGRTVELRFDASQRSWRAVGADGSAEEFAAVEMELFRIISETYEDALANLNMGPGAQPSSAPSATPSRREPPARVACGGWILCNGPVVVQPDIGLSAASCCEGARAAGDLDCLFVGNSLCSTCCSGSCSTLCLIGNSLCSCTFTGRACGSTVDIPCEEPPWPPECV